MADNELLQPLDLKEFVSLNIKYLHFFGYFSPQLPRDAPKKICYEIYSFLFIGCSFFLVLLTQMADLITSFGDIEKMTDSTFLLFTNYVQALKLYCFKFQGEKVWNLIHSMNRKEFQPINQKQRRILVEEIKMSKFITRLLYAMCTLTVSSWAISPFLDEGQQGRKLPLCGWYPFRTDLSPTFEVVFIYQILTTWFNGLADLSMDVLISGTIMAVSAQLSLLNIAVENMNKKDPGKEEAGELTPIEVRQSLIQNVVHHRNIIQFSTEATSLFSDCITAQFIFGALIICMSMFQISIVSVLSFRFFAMSTYQACVLLEFYLWCYYGNELILKSDELTQSAFLCEWPDCSKDFKNDLILYMTKSQFPLKLYASGYFKLSLETFKAIVKSSWSYFVVLNQVHSEKV